MMTASAHVPTAPHYASFEVDQELRLVDGSIVANDEIEIVHELGRGGMSVVYRAVDLADGRREVVLKVANASSSTTTTTRFRNEARLGERLREHPNVAVASRVGQLDGPEGFEGRTYLVMDLVEGASLASVMADHRIGLQWQRACEIALDVAIALEALHGTGVVHRDIKPANVLLTADKAVLIDFGLAYSTGDGWTERSPDLTQEGDAPGTLLYMSPEQVGHAKPAPSMDTYSFGVMLYELFTGNPPYHRLSQAEMVARKCDPGHAPYPLTKICPDLDERLTTLVHRCLRHAPEERPTAVELRETLEGLLERPVVAAVPQTESPHSRVRPGLLAIGTLGLLGLAWWLWPADPGAPASVATTNERPAMTGHMATQTVEPPTVGTPAGERVDRPSLASPSPVEAETEIQPGPSQEKEDPTEQQEDPPERPAAEKRADDPCPDRLEAAQRAKRESKWGAVLRLTKQEQCWTGASKTERKKLRTQALFETGRYADCVVAGRGLTDPDAVRWVHICESKSGSEADR